MVETVLLALVVGKIKGYKLKPLFASWHIYPVAAFMLIYILFEAAIFMGNYNFIAYSVAFERFYLLSFLFVIFKYRQYVSAVVGSMFVIIGTILNKIAISANGGKMPVFPTLSYLTGYAKPEAFTKVSDIHILGGSFTKLKALTDVIDMGYSIMSIGDICIRFFVFVVVLNTMKYINNAEKSHSGY